MMAILPLEKLRGECFLWRGMYPFWCLLTEPTQVWRVFDPADLEPALAEIFEAGTKAGKVGGWIAYEAAHYLAQGKNDGVSERPLLEFAQFAQSEHYQYLDAGEPLQMSELQLEWDRETYRAKFDQVHRNLAEGRNYQTNLTFATHFNSPLDAADLFSAWCGVEPPPYASLCRLGTDIVSLSPELFFNVSGAHLTCLPMKGTAPGDSDPSILTSDPKTQAENLMITDMVRNDIHSLGRVVQMECDLFQVRRHGSVLQMTSRIACRHRSDMPHIFRALFPAASVTGAPKHETMKIISELETSPRGVYCGGIGYLAGAASEFSVPIRTAEHMGAGRWRYRIGSGIVWDSDADQEYDECLLKAQVLKNPPEPFGLIETFLVENGEIALFEGHWERLSTSCTHFGIRFDEATLRQMVSNLADGVYRLAVYSYGRTSLTEKPSAPDIVRASRDVGVVNWTPPGMQHKITDRRRYGDGRERLWSYPFGGVEVTEFTTGNLVAQIDGQLFTPPAFASMPGRTTRGGAYQLLPGVARAHWIKTGKLHERILTMEDLDRAEAVYHLNAARGLRPVEFTD